MMIAYPGYNGLPEWEPTREILEGVYDPNASASDAYDVNINININSTQIQPKLRCGGQGRNYYLVNYYRIMQERMRKLKQ